MAAAFDSRPSPTRSIGPEAEDGIYQDRFDAGRKLTHALAKYRRRKTLLVLAISPQGVEVALPIAEFLRAPLDLVISSLLPIPGRPESSFGSIVDDTIVVNDGLVAGWGITRAQVQHIAADVQDTARHRMLRLRGDRPLPDVNRKTVIIVDDGLDVGFPVVAAVEWVERQHPRDVVVTIPVAPRHEIERLIPLTSQVICPIQRDTWNLSIAAFYRRWQEPTDDRVAAFLRRVTASTR